MRDFYELSGYLIKLLDRYHERYGLSGTETIVVPIGVLPYSGFDTFTIYHSTGRYEIEESPDHDYALIRSNKKETKPYYLGGCI